MVLAVTLYWTITFCSILSTEEANLALADSESILLMKVIADGTEDAPHVQLQEPGFMRISAHRHARNRCSARC